MMFFRRMAYRTLVRLRGEMTTSRALEFGKGFGEVLGGVYPNGTTDGEETVITTETGSTHSQTPLF